MPYRKAPTGHSEYGGGPGLIDPEVRKDRALSSADELIEIYSTNPTDPDTSPEDVDIHQFPKPVPHIWPDKSTRKGTN